jgi:hypothetical protein
LVIQLQQHGRELSSNGRQAILKTSGGIPKLLPSYPSNMISKDSDGQTAQHSAYKLDNVWSALGELSGKSQKKDVIGISDIHKNRKK